MSAQNFIWYELLTSDPKAAEAFYTAVVGWNAEPFGGTDAGYTVVKAGERGVAGIMAMPDAVKAMGAPPCWLGYIYAADVDAATAGVETAGGKVQQPPVDIPGVGRFAVVADPQGANFMIMSPQGEDQPPVAMMTPGHVGWHELYAGEWQAAFDFYAAQFGWTKVDAMDMGPAGTYLLYGTGGAESVGGIMTKPDTVPAPMWMFYFAVDDIDAAVQRVTDHGGTVAMGPMEVPGGAWVIQGVDPQGAMFALVGWRK